MKGSRVSQNLFGKIFAQILKMTCYSFWKNACQLCVCYLWLLFDKIISTGRRIHIFNRSVTKEKTLLDYYKSPCKRLNTYCAITIVFIYSSHYIQRETFCNRLADICDSFDYQNSLRKSRFKKVSPYKIYTMVKY